MIHIGISRTGHAEIDHQHAILEHMLDDLARFCAESVRDPTASCDKCSAGTRRRCAATLASITDEIRTFLVGHATYEERLMDLLPRNAKCIAHVQAHTAAHTGIAKNLKRFAEQIDKECPKLHSAQLQQIVRWWIGDHAVQFDAVLVSKLGRAKNSEIEFDGELVAILDEHVFHNRPKDRKSSAVAIQTLDRQRLEIRGRFESLSPAQRGVFWLVVGGCKNSEIVAQLGISINTVKTHRAAIFQKMDVSSVLDLIRKTEVLRDSLRK